MLSNGKLAPICGANIWKNCVKGVISINRGRSADFLRRVLLNIVSLFKKRSYER